MNREVTVVNYALGLSHSGEIVGCKCQGHIPSVLVNMTDTLNDDVLHCLECGRAYVRAQYAYVPSRRLSSMDMEQFADLPIPPEAVRVMLYDLNGRQHRVWVPRTSCGAHTPSYLTVARGDTVICNDCHQVYVIGAAPNLLVGTDRVIDLEEIVSPVFAGAWGGI